MEPPIEQFRQACKDWVEHNTRTPQIAHDCLVRIGIYPENGELAPPYRNE